jgi:hypothetical protein
MKVQREVYGKRALSDAAHESRRQQQPRGAGAIVHHPSILGDRFRSAKDLCPAVNIR